MINTREEPERPTPAKQNTEHINWASYAWSILLVALATGLATLMFQHVALVNLIMVYLLAVVVVALRFGQGPSILTALLSVAAFDFFFAPPLYSFAVSDSEYLITFAAMLIIALIISNLAARVRQQVEAARERERRITTLYAISRELAVGGTKETLVEIAIRHISEVFESQVWILLPTENGQLKQFQREQDVLLNGAELLVAQWVYQHKLMAGLGTQTLPSAKALYLPLSVSSGVVGVLGVSPNSLFPNQFLVPEQIYLLETIASQVSLAIERANLGEEAQAAAMEIETERLRNSLLSTVSHDLRTPLASITGAATSILEDDEKFDPAGRRELVTTIYEESERLNRLVTNLLAMTRLESGSTHVHKEWQPLEEVIGAVLTRFDKQLQNRPLQLTVPDDLPMVPIDAVLIEQVLINLLENIFKYTPENTLITLKASATTKSILLEVGDTGPGLNVGEEEQIFSKFFRAKSLGGQTGVGLGLAIVRGIITAHGGKVWAENRLPPAQGAVFRFTLPLG